jgi:tetratricopeptide (TPR) repeat protein
VARVFDIGEHEERIFLTMELVDGPTLRGVLRQEGRLAPARAARIAIALADGLQAAHAAGVVHRDLKPANVLIDRRGRVVITDFGIARSLEGVPDLTVGAIGTPSYMAPEQAVGAGVDARADLYALPEPHLAAGILATQYGHYREAVTSLGRALAIAPTYPDALEYLGVLQIESGQEEGEQRLRLADELDPTLPLSLALIARYHALRGRFDQAEAAIAQMARRGSSANNALRMIRIRLAAWRGDRAELGRISAANPTNGTSWAELFGVYARLALGEDVADAEQYLGAALAAARNPRSYTMLAQLAAEGYAAGGQMNLAWAYLRRAAESVLIDLDWLKRCPPLAPLRQLPGFTGVHGLVRSRAEMIWST